jgi:hypothetical protein
LVSSLQREAGDWLRPFKRSRKAPLHCTPERIRAAVLLRPTNREVQTRSKGDFNGPVPMVRPRILITGGVWLVAHLGDTPTARGFWKKGAPQKLAV